MSVGLFAVQDTMQVAKSRGAQHIGCSWQSLSDFQIGLTVQIGRFNVAQRMGLAVQRRHKQIMS